MIFRFMAEVDEKDGWFTQVPSGEGWTVYGHYDSFEGLVQNIGASVSPEYQIWVDHPDENFCPVVVLRGWKMS